MTAFHDPTDERGAASAVSVALTHDFRLIATGLDYNAPDFADRFFEAGCDDATLSVQKGLIIVDFDREGETIEAAITSAIRDVIAAGAIVIHVEPDPLVTISDIAQRANVTRAAVSNYANGSRGEAFPTPVARVTSESPLWDWVEVSNWFFRNGKLTLDAVRHAEVLKAVNARIAEQRRQRQGEPSSVGTI